MQVIMGRMILQLGHMALGLKPEDAQPGGSLQAHLASSAALVAKVCSKCKMTKSASDFFRDKSKPDGMYSQVSALLCSVPSDANQQPALQQVQKSASEDCPR